MADTVRAKDRARDRAGIRLNIQKEVGTFITNLMEQELTHHVGREKYKRKEGQTDYRNGGYTRTFISTRTLSLLSKRLIGRSLSPTEVSNASTEMKQAIERWRTRGLSLEQIEYLFLMRFEKCLTFRGHPEGCGTSGGGFRLYFPDRQNYFYLLFLFKSCEKTHAGQDNPCC